MAKVQTRRSVSISRERYAALQRLAAERGQSMAAVVDQLICDAATAKPEAVATARGGLESAVVPKGGGPVDAFAARLADALAAQAERMYRIGRGLHDDTAAALADAWCDLADMVRAAVQP